MRRFSLCATALALIWLCLLPYLGTLPAIQSQIRRNNQYGIDPSAKFYTELDGRHRLLGELAERRRQNVRAFWIP